MPIRRRDDGEIVKEPTEPVKKARSAEAADTLTDRQGSGGEREDSLFKPTGGEGGGGERLEKPTVPMGVDREAGSHAHRYAAGPQSRYGHGRREISPTPCAIPPSAGWSSCAAPAKATCSPSATA